MQQSHHDGVIGWSFKLSVPSPAAGKKNMWERSKRKRRKKGGEPIDDGGAWPFLGRVRLARKESSVYGKFDSIILYSKIGNNTEFRGDC